MEYINHSSMCACTICFPYDEEETETSEDGPELHIDTLD